jgi:hypothetical protein
MGHASLINKPKKKVGATLLCFNVKIKLLTKLINSAFVGE